MKTINDLRSLTIAAGFGALMFFFNFIASTTMVTLTGIPGTGGVAVGVLLGYLIAILVMLVPRTGVITVAFLVFGILSVPTIVMGPPGLYKLGLLPMAIIMDACLALIKQRKAALYIGMSIGLVSGMIAFYYLLLAMGFPAAERFGKYILPITAVLVAEVLLGIWLGILTYEKRLKKLKVVRQMQE